MIKFNRVLLLLIVGLMPSALLANTIYFPHAVYGGGYSTSFVVMNTGTTNVSGTISFYSTTTGVCSTCAVAFNLAVGRSTRFTFPDTGPLRASWGVIDAGGATVQGVATFDLRANGSLSTTVGVLAPEAGSSFLLPVDLTSTASTGVAIANTTASAVNVRLRLIGEDGSAVATANDVSLNPLPAHRQVAKFVDELFPQLSGTTFKGTLIVEASTGAPANSLAATALTVKEGLFSALPVIPAGPPIFQSDLIRMTVVQLAVTQFNLNAALTLTIENISPATVYLDLVAGSFALTDDLGTGWRIDSAAGIQNVSSTYTYAPGKQADFTAIGPSERITVILNSIYRSSGGATPGHNFSFAALGTYYTSTGLKNVSIGLTNIKANFAPN